MQKENATCQLSSVRRSDHFLSSGLLGDPDEDKLLNLQESYPGEPEEKKYSSGSTDWNQSSGELSLGSMIPGMSGVSKLRSGESTMSRISVMPQYSSLPGGYGIQCQLSCETVAAVAGIPTMQSNISSSLLNSGSIHSGSIQYTQSRRTPLQQLSGGSFTPDKSCRGGTPQQVEDDDEQLNWNPISDVMHRINSKIRFLVKFVSLAESDANLLSVVKGIYFVFKLHR